MEFVAIDFETANADMASICQIGLVCYKERLISDIWKTNINPEDYFDPINISIHGVTEDAVRDAPTLPKVVNQLQKYLSEAIVVCHTHFDRVALTQAFEKYGLQMPKCTWIDSARVARRAWEDFARRGYGLDNVCSFLGYHFSHHDALEDAKAAAFVILSAIDKTGLSLTELLNIVRRPIGYSSESKGLGRVGNPEGPFYGEVIVFTGTLSISRRQAADMAARVGYEVAEVVNKKTTILVVGDQDIKRLAGHTKSSKHHKAEALILEGQAIRILKESDFQQLVNIAEMI